MTKAAEVVARLKIPSIETLIGLKGEHSVEALLLARVGLSLEEAVEKLENILENTAEPERLEHGEYTWQVQSLTVTTILDTVAEVQQGPNIAIPKGYATVIRQRRHVGSPVGYISHGPEALVDGHRIVLADNDSVTINLGNWNELFFAADTATTVFEMWAERG